MMLVLSMDNSPPFESEITIRVSFKDMDVARRNKLDIVPGESRTEALEKLWRLSRILDIEHSADSERVMPLR